MPKKNNVIKVEKENPEVNNNKMVELFHIWDDIEYYAQKYCRVWFKEEAKYVPFVLMPTQKKVLDGYGTYDNNLVLKYRQGGISTVTELYISHILFSTADIKIGIVANTKELAKKFLKECTDFIFNLPEEISLKTKKNAADHKIFTNNSEIKAFACSSDGIRGFSPDILIIDEAAYLEEDGYGFWTSARGSLSAGGKIILISCVTDDTFIYTDKGIKQVSNFINYENNGGYLINEYSILGKDKIRSSNIMFNNGLCDTKIITTSNSQVECSLPHKWWAFSQKEQKYDWYKTEDLKVGDYIAIQYGMELWGNNNDVSDFNPTTYRVSNKFNPKIITKEIAYFLGIFIAEGSAYKKKETITISCGDDVLKKLRSIGLNFNLAKDKIHYTIGSKNLIEFLEYLGFNLSLKSPEKYIPSRLLEMSRENIIELVKGMFDGDGCIEHKRKRVSYVSTSLKLIKQLREILHNFGILNTFESKLTKPTKKVKVFSQIYTLNISDKNCISYCKKIGFDLDRKKIISENILKDNFIFKKSSKDVLPNGKIIMKDLSIKYKIHGKHLDKNDYEFNRFSKLLNQKKINETDCNVYNFLGIYKQIKNKLNNDDINFIDSIINENIKWSKITKIEDSKNKTYDFSLPNDENDLNFCHSVIYNSFIGHQTPNGMDDVYYATYNAAINKKNNFNIIEIKWWQDIRFNKNLTFKFNDDTEPITDVWIVKKDGTKVLDNEKCLNLIAQGYKPTSPWYEKQCADYDYDIRRINQELECKFLGSGGNMIDEKSIMDQETKNVKIPLKQEYRDRNLWIWEEPKEEGRYIVGVDVSNGNSDDYSTIEIIDIDSFEQVAEYQGRIPKEELGELVFYLAMKYNEGFVVMDVTGGSGSVPMLIILNKGYKNIYYTDNSNKAIKEKLEDYLDNNGNIPGFIISNNRPLILQDFEKVVRLNEFKIRSTRLLSEIKTFVWNKSKNRFDHMRSSHDDCIFACVIALAGLSKYNQNKMDGDKAAKMASLWRLGNYDFEKENNSQYKKNPNNNVYGSYTSPFGGNNPASEWQKYLHLLLK